MESIPRFGVVNLAERAAECINFTVDICSAVALCVYVDSIIVLQEKLRDGAKRLVIPSICRQANATPIQGQWK